MMFELPDDDVLYDALLARDHSYDQLAFVAVTSTGIFCRLSCSARKPKRENSIFFTSVAACMAAGYRACKRCRPLAPAAEADPVVGQLLTALEKNPIYRWKETDLRHMGLDPSTVRRAFKRHFGITFLDMARLERLRRGAAALSGGSRIIDAQQEAAFDSASGFRSAFARVLGQSPAQSRGHELLLADWIETPIGAMIAITDSSRLHLLEFFDRKALPNEIRVLQKQAKGRMGVGRFDLLDSIETELENYFNSGRSSFSTALNLFGGGFAREVWSELQKIPAGETRSYSDIAKAIGKPEAVRAVARANGENRIALLIPCHRVISADGTLNGYGGGIWRKRWLIDHERKNILKT